MEVIGPLRRVAFECGWRDPDHKEQVREYKCSAECLPTRLWTLHSFVPIFLTLDQEIPQLLHIGFDFQGCYSVCKSSLRTAERTPRSSLFCSLPRLLLLRVSLYLNDWQCDHIAGASINSKKKAIVRQLTRCKKIEVCCDIRALNSTVLVSGGSQFLACTDLF